MRVYKRQNWKKQFSFLRRTYIGQPEIKQLSKDFRMMNSKAVSLIFVLVYISHTYGNKIISHTQEWSYYSDDNLILPKTAFKNNTFSYAECDSEGNANRNCTIDLQILSDAGFTSQKKCSSYFEDKGKVKSKEGLPLLTMQSLSNDKIIFSYGLTQVQDFDKEPFDFQVEQVIRIVDMATCEYHEAVIPLNITESEEIFAASTLEEANLVHYNDDTMDFFFINKNTCSDGGRCKVTINLKGQIVGKPVAYLPLNMTLYDVHMFPLTSSNSPNNYFALVQNFKTHGLTKESIPENYHKNIVNKLMYAVGNGESVDVIDFLSEGQFLDIDDSFGKLGICWADKSNASQIICRQYNSSNEKQTEVTFPLLATTRLLRIRNTLGGGFYLLIGECTDENCENHKNLVLMEIGSDGKILESIALNSFTCVASQNHREIVISMLNHIYEILEGQKDNLCVSKTCISGGKIRITRQCFDKSVRQ